MKEKSSAGDHKNGFFKHCTGFVKVSGACFCRKTMMLLLLVALSVTGYGTADICSAADSGDTIAPKAEVKASVSDTKIKKAVFTAEIDGRAIAGVKIKIDGHQSGLTDEYGRLEKQWLCAGVHQWQAVYKGAEIASGRLEVPKVVAVEITDRGAVMNGKRNREQLRVRPFMENWTGFFEVKNTGTTFLDHCNIRLKCPMKNSDAMQVDLLSPYIPSFIWKPFLGSMLNLCSRRVDVAISDGRVRINDAYTGHAIAVREVHSSASLGSAGLAPGEKVLAEFTEPYRKCIEGFVQSVGAKKNMNVSTEIVDREDGVMHMIVKKYKFGFITFDRIVVELIFKGGGECGFCSLKLAIDDKVYDTVPWIAWEWL